MADRAISASEIKELITKLNAQCAGRKNSNNQTSAKLEIAVNKKFSKAKSLASDMAKIEAKRRELLNYKYCNDSNTNSCTVFQHSRASGTVGNKSSFTNYSTNSALTSGAAFLTESSYLDIIDDINRLNNTCGCYSYKNYNCGCDGHYATCQTDNSYCSCNYVEEGCSCNSNTGCDCHTYSCNIVGHAVSSGCSGNAYSCKSVTYATCDNRCDCDEDDCSCDEYQCDCESNIICNTQKCTSDNYCLESCSSNCDSVNICSDTTTCTDAHTWSGQTTAPCSCHGDFEGDTCNPYDCTSNKVCQERVYLS